MKTIPQIPEQTVQTDQENKPSELVMPSPSPTYYSDSHARAKARFEEFGIPWKIINEFKEAYAKSNAANEGKQEEEL